LAVAVFNFLASLTTFFIKRTNTITKNIKTIQQQQQQQQQQTWRT